MQFPRGCIRPPTSSRVGKSRKMCIMVLAVQCHQSLPFIFAHNRDEDRCRCSLPDSFEKETKIVCSRDGRCGGFVLGLKPNIGRFAALTNVQTKHQRPMEEKTSRGLLVERLLSNRSEVDDAAQFREVLAGGLFDAFKIVYGDASSAEPKIWYAWQAPEEDENTAFVGWRVGEPKLLEKGVFVMSNENPTYVFDDGNANIWPKCLWLKENVEKFITTLGTEPSMREVHSGLESLMSQYNVPGILPPQVLPSHLTIYWELQHTGPFVPWCSEYPDYGTVSQRIIINSVNGVGLTYFCRSTNDGFSDDAEPKIGQWEKIDFKL